MKKRFNRIAVALWVIAALSLVAKLGALAIGSSLATKYAGVSTDSTLQPVLRSIGRMFDSYVDLNTITDAVLGAAQLAGLATIIEIVDRIRWQARPLDSA